MPVHALGARRAARGGPRGRGRDLKIFLRIVLPLSEPVALRFLQGQFDQNYGGLMAMALTASLPLVVLFLVLQRFFVEGLARSGIK